MTLGIILGTLLAISGIMQGWSRSNRRQGIRYAAAEAPKRQIRQDDEMTARRREASTDRVRFVDRESGEVL